MLLLINYYIFFQMKSVSSECCCPNQPHLRRSRQNPPPYSGIKHQIYRLSVCDTSCYCYIFTVDWQICLTLETYPVLPAHDTWNAIKLQVMGRSWTNKSLMWLGKNESSREVIRSVAHAQHPISSVLEIVHMFWVFGFFRVVRSSRD